MDFEERLGIRGAYYFMTARPGRFDRGYDLTVSPYDEIVAEVRERGHEVGWHPGYTAADSEEVFATEKQRMDNIFGGSRYGGRHHYLRWSAGNSWDQWQRHGLAYDSSVGWAENIGFRCGTCHPFPCFSLKQQVELDLLEQPLVIMDEALTRCVGLGEEFDDLCMAILRRAKSTNGMAVVLTHNSDYSPAVHKAIRGAIESILSCSC